MEILFFFGRLLRTACSANICLASPYRGGPAVVSVGRLLCRPRFVTIYYKRGALVGRLYISPQTVRLRLIPLRPLPQKKGWPQNWPALLMSFICQKIIYFLLAIFAQVSFSVTVRLNTSLSSVVSGSTQK